MPGAMGDATEDLNRTELLSPKSKTQLKHFMHPYNSGEDLLAIELCEAWNPDLNLRRILHPMDARARRHFGIGCRPWQVPCTPK